MSAIGVTVVLVAGSCSSSGSSSTPSPSASSVALGQQTQAQLQKVLDDVRTKFGFPGVEAGVWSDSGEWIGVSGTAGPGQTQAPTAADHTRIGSITKTFTGTAVLQLIEDGQLSFDDVINKYVPGMPNGDMATIKNLIEMQSGIPSYTASTDIVNEFNAKPTTVFTPQQLVNSVKKEKPDFAPGARFSYSNTNYVLLGMVIEKVTGKSIADVYKERILDPLKLSQTSVPGNSPEIPAPFLSGTSTQANPIGEVKNATNWSPTLAFTAGEMISTLEDLHKWGVALGTGQGILKPDTQQMRLDSVNTSVPPNTPQRSYGMGIVNTGGWLGHTGEIPGYNTVLNYRPDSHTTIAVMVNSDIALGPENAPIAPAVAVFEGLAAVMTPGGPPSPSASSS